MHATSYHLHAEGAVVDGFTLDVDVHQRAGLGAAVTGAKGDGHERLVTHDCGWLWTRPVESTHGEMNASVHQVRQKTYVETDKWTYAWG